MARERGVRLTKFELDVMNALWELGAAASIREVHEALSQTKQVAYTTVQTIVGRLEEKGAVRRVRKIGNAFIFEPTIDRRAAHRRLVDEFLDMLGGARPLMAHLLEAGKLSLDDLREIEASIEAPRPLAQRKKR